MENMELYERFRVCPPEALRQIQAGKLKGKSDINPMWRIKALTEAFGPQGIGWKLDNVRFWSEDAPNGEKMAFCSLDLVYKLDGEWSAPVPGIGGSGIIKLERGELATNDEGYKMAMTDAISVAAKGLGVAANVYWDKDNTKYSQQAAQPSKPAGRQQPPAAEPASQQPSPLICKDCGKPIQPARKGENIVTAEAVAQSCGGSCIACWRARKSTEAQRQIAAAQQPADGVA